MAPRVVALASAFPPHRHAQRAIYEAAAARFPSYRSRAIERVFLNGDIEHRHLAFPLEDFRAEETPDELHARFARWAPALARDAIAQCLERAAVGPEGVDLIVTASCTGYLCPGISALLLRSLPFRADVQRSDLVGMGCSGALPALQRAHDFVRAHPGKRALAVCVEVCSACWFVDDTLETAVGNAICADAAVAALVADRGEGPEIERFETRNLPELHDAVGFRFVAGKLRIVLAKEIRSAAGELARGCVDHLLASASLERAAIDRWVVHAGGRRVLDGIEEALALSPDALANSRHVLRNHGNCSSPTVLLVLERATREARPGDRGVLLALGPGVSVEAALLRW